MGKYDDLLQPEPTPAGPGKYADLIEAAPPPSLTPETDKAVSDTFSLSKLFGPPQTQEQYMAMHGRPTDAAEQAARVGRAARETVWGMLQPAPVTTTLGPIVGPLVEYGEHAVEAARKYREGAPREEVARTLSPEYAMIQQAREAPVGSQEWWNAVVPLTAEAAQYAPILLGVPGLRARPRVVPPEIPPAARAAEAPIPPPPLAPEPTVTGTAVTARVAPPAEPVIEQIGYKYKYDPASDRWKAIDDEGNIMDTIRPEEGEPQRRLVESLNIQREQATRGGEEVAVKEREIAEGAPAEYPGVPPREPLPAYAPEVREGGGEPAGGRRGVRPEEAEPEVVAREAVEKPPAPEIPDLIPTEAPTGRVFQSTLEEQQGAAGNKIRERAALQGFDTLSVTLPDGAVQHYALDKEALGVGVRRAAPPPAPAPAPEAAPVTSYTETLQNEIARLRSEGRPVPIRMTQELEQLQKGAAPAPEPAGLQWRTRMAQLEDQAADLQNQLGDYLGKPLTPKEHAVQDQLWDTFNEIHAMREESGEPRDFVIVGGGAAGLKAAGHAAYEGLDVLVLEREPTVGGQAKRSGEIVNVGATGRGITGREYFRARELTARNRGAQIRTGVEAVNFATRPDGGVDVITKHHGTIPARRVAVLSGSKVNVHTNVPGFQLSGWGNAERLARLARGKTGMVYGAGNSASQAVITALRNGAQKIVMVSRHPFGPEVSADQKTRIQRLAKEGRVELVTDEINHIAPDPDTGGLIVRTKGKKEFPVAHLENFLDTTLNTGWLPADIEKVTMPAKGGRPAKPGPVKVLDASLKTTMPGVYAGGDIRESLPGEERPRRIDMAEGDAAGIAARVVKDIYKGRKEGKLPEWLPREEVEAIDVELKRLKGLEEAEEAPTAAGAPGTIPGIQAPKKAPISPPISRTSAEKRPLETPSIEPEKPEAAKPPAGYGAPKKEPELAPGYGRPPPPTPSLVEAEGAARVQADQARARVAENPRHADMLITELGSAERQLLDGADEMVLVHHRALLQDARDKAGRRAMNETLTEGQRAEAAATFNDLDGQILLLDAATREGTVIRGVPQEKMWHQFRARDYDFPAMEMKLTVARGGKALTPPEAAKLRTQTDKLSNLMADVENMKRRTGWRPGLGAKVDPRLRDLQADAFEVKTALDDAVFKAKMKNKALAQRALQSAHEIISVQRALMTSVDLSAVRRQGGILFMAHPIRAIKLMPDMLRAAASDRSYFKLMQDIRERPNALAGYYDKMLTDVVSPKVTQMEEAYMSRWANLIPIIAHSQRAYVYFLNRLRADSFDAMAATLSREGPVTPKQADYIANFVSVFTGRGRLPGDYAMASQVLNDTFFAPRYVVSRFQALTGQPLRYAKDPAVRALIAGEYARALIGYGVVYGLASTALKEFVNVEYDPRSTDFGKVRIGDTRIDFLSGLSQPTVLMTRLGLTALGLPSYKTRTGELQTLKAGGPRTNRIVSDIITDFTRSKLAPMPAAAWNAVEGKKVTGEPTTPVQELANMLVPMTGRDVYKAIQKYGVAGGTALGLIAFFGDSVNTYSAKSTARRRKRHRAR